MPEDFLWSLDVLAAGGFCVFLNEEELVEGCITVVVGVLAFSGVGVPEF